jgi:broad-specificity NMP kinase
MSYAKRVTRAQARGTKASKVFEDLEAEFLTASQEAREVHDELQVEIDHLVRLQEEAMNVGLQNQHRAARVRETLL